MPLTIAEMDYVIVDNGTANPGELAIGRVHNVDDELVEVHWHALKDAPVPAVQGHGSLERAQLDLAPRVEDPLVGSQITTSVTR